MNKTVVMFIVILCWFSFSHATMDSKSSGQADSVSYDRSENLTKGHYNKLKVDFSSKVEKDESVSVTLVLRKKIFMAIITQGGSVDVNSFYVKTGNPANINGKDVVVLNSLYAALQDFVDLSALSDKMLIRFIEYLIAFHPVDSYFDNAMTTKIETASNELIEPMGSFCALIEDAKEHVLDGEYTISRLWRDKGYDCGANAERVELSNRSLICRERDVPVGPNSKDCVGRCGPGCQSPRKYPFNERYTQECLNHDLCMGATGWHWNNWLEVGPCGDEYRVARTTYLGGNNTEPCSIPPFPYADYGACPFECCQYGPWTSEKDIIIAREQFGSEYNPHSITAFTVHQGEKVQALTGVVVTNELGHAEVKKPCLIGNFPAQVGDYVWLLSYAGEGYYKVWYKGEISYVLPDDPSNDYDGGEYAETIIIKEPKYDWWVKIKNWRGQVGWTNEPFNFYGNDACG